MSMTESEALGMLRAKLTCMELEDLACVEKGCDKDCDNCNYCYEQGNRGQSKEALSVAISALEELQKIKELGDCYIIPKNSTWEVNGIDIHKALSEIQQYRAIGTVEEVKTLHNDYWKLNEICKEYSAIGTVSEFRELKEKATAKKVDVKEWIYTKCDCGYEFSKHHGDGYYSIPYERKTNYCPKCGQKLDWSEGKE